MIDDELKEVRVTMGSIERRGAWIVPEHLDVRVMWGSCELDLRDAKLSPGLTTIDVQITMGNVEIIVPPGMNVMLDVHSVAGNVADGEHLQSTLEGDATGEGECEQREHPAPHPRHQPPWQEGRRMLATPHLLFGVPLVPALMPAAMPLATIADLLGHASSVRDNT